MKQKAIFLFLMLAIIAVLIGLNAASYAPAEKEPDVESLPHRSTFNAGSTGLQAYFSLLAETGHKAVRWQEPPAALLTAGEYAPKVFVIAGTLRKELKPAESADLLTWVARGGTLVVIDREPPASLLVTTSNWVLRSPRSADSAIYSADPADPASMTAGVAAVRPTQPTVVTYNVNAVQPSTFAGAIDFEYRGSDEDDIYYSDEPGADDPPIEAATPSLIAPVAHLSSPRGDLLVESQYGDGRILVLADPYIVSNGGIALADNVTLAVNLVGSAGGPIAFDEYHQGYGTDNNRFLQFFAGTPVIPIFLQAALLVGLLFLSQSRRFARPLPEPEPDRRSKLEYVAAMAELQRRSGAYDLAIENIFTDLRRRIARNLGLEPASASTPDLAAGIAERTGGDRFEIEETLFRCEEIIRGEPAGKSDVIKLIARLRELETELGLSRTRRLGK